MLNLTKVHTPINEIDQELIVSKQTKNNKKKSQKRDDNE
jgi:hypothetical protein